MMTHPFGKSCRVAIVRMVESLVENHREEIEDVYLQEQGTLDIGFKVQLRPSQRHSGSVDVTVNINFVTGRVKDSLLRVVDDAQGALPFGEHEEEVVIV